MPEITDTRRFFFEITDIVEYVRQGNLRVTGIQRVQLNLIRLMAEKFGAERVRCLCYRGRDNAMLEFEPNQMLDLSDEFDGEKMLFRLGFIQDRGKLPSPITLKRYLRNGSSGKWQRACKKLDLLLSALFFPRRFRRTGLVRACDLFQGVNRLEVRQLHGLSAQDSLVFLGVNWKEARVVDFAFKHAKEGGDIVQFMHDLIPVIRPEYCTDSTVREFSDWLNHAVVPLVSRVVCNSSWTARDFCQHIQLRRMPGDVGIVPLAHEFFGYSRTLSPTGLLPIQVRGAGEFVLCVGTIEIRKNGAMLLRCWLRLYAELGERLPRLVFVGKRGWLADEFYALLSCQPTLLRWVVLIEAPSDQELAALYRACLFAVYPSCYEGWGLPVGEAAWFGKYSIVSNRSSLPEVCGNLVDYVDPENEESIVAALGRAIRNRAYIRNKEQQIELVPLRTWLDVANDMWRILNEEPTCGSVGMQVERLMAD